MLVDTYIRVIRLFAFSVLTTSCASIYHLWQHNWTPEQDRAVAMRDVKAKIPMFSLMLIAGVLTAIPDLIMELIFRRS